MGEGEPGVDNALPHPCFPLPAPAQVAMKRILFAAILLCSLAGWVWAAEVPIPPSPARWATDPAGWLAPDTLSSIDRQLEDYQRATGHQVLLYIAPTTGDTPTEDWTIKAFERWKVGRKGLDDGLALFIFPQDRKVRIEVGYGLEGQVPDAIASRIIREVILPRIEKGDQNAAATAGVSVLLNVIQTGKIPVEDEPNSGPGSGTGVQDQDTKDLSGAVKHLSTTVSDLTLFQKIIIGLLILGFLVLLITHPGMALWILFSLLSGGRGGGGGGGGFSGGGGGGGGGGASGSW